MIGYFLILLPPSLAGDGALLMWALEQQQAAVAQHLLLLLPPHTPALPSSATGTLLEPIEAPREAIGNPYGIVKEPLKRLRHFKEPNETPIEL